MSQLRRLYWTELPGNKYLKKVEPAMLVDGGIVCRQEIKPIGAYEKEWVEVEYDRVYVETKVKIELLNPLNCELPDLPGLLGVQRQVSDIKGYKLRGEDVVRVADLVSIGILVNLSCPVSQTIESTKDTPSSALTPSAING